MKAALQRVAAAHGEALRFLCHRRQVQWALAGTADTIVPQTDGSIVLKAAQADHFMNYNGRGYEAPARSISCVWNVAAKPGSYRVVLRYRPTLQNAGRS